MKTGWWFAAVVSAQFVEERELVSTAAKSHSASTDATVSYEFIAEKIVRSRAAAGMSFLPADDDPDSPRWTTLSLADPRLSSPQEQQPSIKSVAARDNV